MTGTISREFRAHVSEEVGKVRLEVANLRTEMAHLWTEVETDIANLRAEFKSDISEVRKTISIQTRWIVVALLGGAILYPIGMKLIS